MFCAAGSRHELKGRSQKEFAKYSGNKAFAKGNSWNGLNAVKAKNRLTGCSVNQPHNEAVKGEQANRGKSNNKNRKPR